MPLHTTVLGAEDLQKSSASTLDQLLKNLPGLNFTSLPSAQTDPTGQSTKMRGLGNAKVLLLLDGVPVMDPFYLTTQWFKLPLSNIERVEVVRGGNSSLWGNMAVAGVINVVSKRVKDDAGEWGLSVGSRGMNDSERELDRRDLPVLKEVAAILDTATETVCRELNAFLPARVYQRPKREAWTGAHLAMAV